jgi:UDP-glucose 4-epimerase
MTEKAIVIVTGGAGFIGSHMVDNLLDHGYRVRTIDNLVSGRESNIAHLVGNPDFSFERADIRDLHPGNKLFAQARYVFHFAGIGDIVPSIEHPLEYMSANIQGTVHVLECARHVKVQKLV